MILFYYLLIIMPASLLGVLYLNLIYFLLCCCYLNSFVSSRTSSTLISDKFKIADAAYEAKVTRCRTLFFRLLNCDA